MLLQQFDLKTILWAQNEVNWSSETRFAGSSQACVCALTPVIYAPHKCVSECDDNRTTVKYADAFVIVSHLQDNETSRGSIIGGFLVRCGGLKKG